MGIVQTSVASQTSVGNHDTVLMENRRDAFSYPQLVGVRILLGVAEAGLFPGIMY